MKKSRIFFTIILLGLVSYALWKGRTPAPRALTIYTYSAFASSWGAGPAVAQEFEKICDCKVHFVSVGDGRALLQRLKLENGGDADLAIGFDQFALKEAESLGIWRSPPVLDVTFHPEFEKVHQASQFFVPYDWAPLAFIYRKGEIEPPKSLQDLKNPIYAKSFAMMDPRSSTPGYQLITWFSHFFPGEAGVEYLKAIQPSVFNVSPSWSGAYGLFKKKQARLVFSYLTSPVYHWVQEHDESYQPAIFKEPHPFQVEYFGILKTCRQCELAEKFSKFLLTESAQRKLMDMNFMFPVANVSIEGTPFARLPQISLVVTEPADDLVKKWTEVFQ